MALWGTQLAVKLRTSKTTSRLMTAAEAVVARARRESFILFVLL